MERFFIHLILLSTICFVITSCGSRPQSAKDQDIVRKYQSLIGCDRYSQLKPLTDDYPKVKEQCREHYSTIDPSKEFINATVFKGMSQDVLFVHLTYKSQERQRDAVNYIYSTERDTILGSYRCY